jgi:hypothetical protein
LDSSEIRPGETDREAVWIEPVASGPDKRAIDFVGTGADGRAINKQNRPLCIDLRCRLARREAAVRGARRAAGGRGSRRAARGARLQQIA